MDCNGDLQNGQSWLDDCFLLDPDLSNKLGVENINFTVEDLFGNDGTLSENFGGNPTCDNTVAEIGGNRKLDDILNAPLKPLPHPGSTQSDTTMDDVFKIKMSDTGNLNIPILLAGSPQEVKPNINDAGIVKMSHTQDQSNQFVFNLENAQNLNCVSTPSTSLQQQISNGRAVENSTGITDVTLVKLLQTYPHLGSQLQTQTQPNSQNVLGNTEEASTFQQIVVPVINSTAAANFVTSPKPLYQLSNNKDSGDGVLTAIPFTDVMEQSLKSDDPRTQKRSSSHNVIEKRYRCSINDKIAQLREMLMSKDSKSNKAAVLKKAIDYINFLTNANKRLKMENAFLKKHLMSNNTVTVRDLVKKDICLAGDVQDILPEVDSSYATPELCSYPTPPHSDPDSPHSSAVPDSPQSMDEFLTGEDVQAISMKNSILARSTRAAFCLFMVAFLAFNPIGTIFHSVGSYSSDGSAPVGRKILEADDTPTYETGWLVWCLGWIINCVVTLILLFKVFAYEEPCLQPHSEQSVRFWRQRKQADGDMDKGDFSSAAKHLRQCLVILKRPLGTSKFDHFCSLIWNAMHLLHNQIKFRNPFKRKQTENEKMHKRTVREAAEIYHKLNQLQLTSTTMDGNMSSLIFALSAVNLAEMAGVDMITEELLAEIYACAALRFKHSASRTFSFMMHFLLTKARNIVKRSESESVAHLTWICHPLAHKFLIDEDLSLVNDVDVFTIDRKANVLEVISQRFGQKMLKKAYFSLVISQNSDITNTEYSLARESNMSQALEYIQIARSSSLPVGSDDVVGNWWCNLASAAAHWNLGDDTTAASFIARVDEPSTNNHPLAATVYAAFCARRDYIALENSTGRSKLMSDANAVIKKCNVASHLLGESLICTNIKKDSSFEAAMLLVSCDWLLNTRTGIWQIAYCTEESTKKAPVEYISAFEQDLNMLRQLSQHLKAVVPQIYLHEATERLMAGACPTRTQQLLGRTIRKRHRSKGEAHDQNLQEAGPRERAAALMLACRHLPHPLLSARGQRADMLYKAVSTFEELGDKRNARDCQKMLLKLGSAGSSTVAS